MKRGRPHALVAGALLGAVVVAVAMPAPADGPAGRSNEWLAVARQMAAPWAALQKRDQSFKDYVVAAAPKGPPRDPYGRSFMGLALLQAGLRDGNDRQIGAGLRAIGAAAAHPVARDRIVFENLALTTAYKLARSQLKGDQRFAAIRPALERRLKHIAVVQFGGSRPYYNYYLVESAGLLELLSTRLTSVTPGSALASRERTRRLITELVNRQIPRIAARYTTRDQAGLLSVLSDPPWNPPAYDAFSLALLARIVRDLGPHAGPAPRELMRRMARSLWALASPQGSVSYFGRSQDQSWTLAMTAYGAEAAASLGGTSAADAARFHALASRALIRLRDEYQSARYGFFITPALADGIASGISGLDRYADAASYSGLTLVGLNWALEQMDADGPAQGPLASDAPGTHRIGVGDGTALTVRTPSLWYAVKQGPGTHVKGVGDYHADVRYDSGLVSLESTPAGGAPTDVVPTRPHSLHRDDHAEPLLLRGRIAARFWGTALHSNPHGGVTLTGGFRAGKRWLRRGVTIRYQPSGCGLRETLPTRRGDRIEQELWFRRAPHRSKDGLVLSDGVQRVMLTVRGRIGHPRYGYASGTEQHLTRVQLRFAGTGRPLELTFCPAGPA
jgi:hypothetical protein